MTGVEAVTPTAPPCPLRQEAGREFHKFHGRAFDSKASIGVEKFAGARGKKGPSPDALTELETGKGVCGARCACADARGMQERRRGDWEKEGSEERRRRKKIKGGGGGFGSCATAAKGREKGENRTARGRGGEREGAGRRAERTVRAAALRGGCPRLRFVGNARSITRRSSSAPSHPRRHRGKGHCPKRHGHARRTTLILLFLLCQKTLPDPPPCSASLCLALASSLPATAAA